MVRISLCAILVITLSACSSIPFQSANTAKTANAGSLIDSHATVGKLVAIDLVNVLSQINVIEPSQTTLYASRPTSRFGEGLVKALQQSGYRLRVANGETEPRLSYIIEPDQAESNYTVIVTAGLVKVKRRYHVDNAHQIVQPTSSIFVLGADGANLKLDDSRFDNQQSALLASTEDSINAPDSQIAMITPVPLKKDIVKQPLTTSNNSTSSSTTSNPAKNAQLKPAQKLNMYETRQSNFDALLGKFETVRREIMIFPNDSLVMGVDNKRIAYEMADNFKAESDVVSVIGCSHGKSNIEDGNSKLANGRADRVREELLLAGIESDLVLHEACWANVHFDEMMPRRGVVVTHKRNL